MFEAIHAQPSIDDAVFAEAYRAIVEQSVQRQNEKKTNLLSKAKITSSMIKKAPCTATKVTEYKRLLDHLDLWAKYDFNLSSLSQFIEDIKSNERFKQHRGALGVRKLLGRVNPPPPIQQVLDANLIPKMIEFLQQDEELQLQIEAGWILGYVTMGTTAQIQSMLDHGALFWLLKALSSKNQQVRETLCWSLTNIACDSSVLRDKLLDNGALARLLKVVNHPEATVGVIKDGVEAILNLCEAGRPLPPVERVKSAIPTLCRVIKSTVDNEVLISALSALSSITRTEETAQMVINYPNTIHTLVLLLSHQDEEILIPSLRTLGYICAGNEAQTNAVIDHPEFFEKMWNIIDHNEKEVRTQIMWILSNVAGGTMKQRDKFFNSFPFVDKLISCIKNDVPEVQIEALWVIVNTLKEESVSEFLSFWDAGLLACYVSILKAFPEIIILKLALDGIYHMLRVAKKMATESHSKQNMVLVELEQREVLNEFDALQDHNDRDISRSVTKIIREFIPLIEIRREESEYDDDSEDDDIWA